ncbi:hypothetical protein SAMN05216368_106187 [Cryobacterium flavum]|uniref:Uncharacterized protein n=1 Tax=Cryobacterium flavum TaxID=1424659 RepID=A0A4R8VFF0_9MICO|nr:MULTISPECIES: hypothetical protein [Cryobacterium]TFB81683.1 hypothetical protein E3O21_02470 [Cryobacterium flavum]TFD04590.1 hypothetical protein E3T29_14560 [Cryobacterium sp. TMT1-66-1]TFD08461.1 hypothetical protein E3T35_17495 [Cryobacterium sp. TMT1-2-2]SDN63783.1 hypothetical protein SAMN05216368_106187 [Cryobacterium flavum]
MISLLNVVLAVTPTPDPDFDPNTVTPGVVGFIVVFLIGAATLLLGFDLVRRIRRTTYRAEITARLEAEIAERDADQSTPKTPGDKPE